jgi:predicted RNA-binding protein
VNWLCELSVLLNKDGESRQIAKDVVYALQNGDTMIVKDILGTPTEVSSAMIAKVNITNETLTLIAHPLVGQFLKFFALLTDESRISDIQQSWNQLKEMGDEFIQTNL